MGAEEEGGASSRKFILIYPSQQLKSIIVEHLKETLKRKRLLTRWAFEAFTSLSANARR